MNASSVAPRRPRVRPGFRLLAIVAFVLLVPIALHSLWDYIEVRRLAQEIAAIRARGEPVTEGEAGRGYKNLSTEEQLGARHYMAAAVLAYPAVAGHWGTMTPLAEYVAGHPPRDFDLAAMKARLGARVTAGEQALRLADEASSMPFDGFQAGTSYSYRTSELMSLLNLLAMRTAHLSLSGRGDAAADSAVRSITSRRIVDEAYHWARRPSFDVPVVLSLAGASNDALRRLERALAAEDRPELVERTILGDRASFIDVLVTQFYGGYGAIPATFGTAYGWRQRQGFVDWLWRPWLTRRFVEALRGWNELVDASRLPWPEKERRMNEIYSRFSHPSRPRPPFSSEQLAPPSSWWRPRAAGGVYAMLPRRFTGLVLDRASRVAIGVVLFRRDHGRLPGSLDELEGDYLPELPLDPHTGEPLRFTSTAEAFTVYSVGPDGRDDGGDLVSSLRERDERGEGVRQLRGNDVGVRVLLNMVQ